MRTMGTHWDARLRIKELACDTLVILVVELIIITITFNPEDQRGSSTHYYQLQREHVFRTVS